MGCSTSKLEDLPAVALCRDRCSFLEDALCQSYALADAHIAYMQSLRTLGPVLHRFYDQIPPAVCGGDPTTVPISKPSKSPPPVTSPSSSNSDSHIQFDSSDDEDTENQIHYVSDTFASVNYSKNQKPTQSAAYSYPNYDNYGTSPYRYHYGTGSRTPPPPPPPGNSAWDFLNFFEAYDRYEHPRTPTRDSKEAVKDGNRDEERQVVKENEKQRSPAVAAEKCEVTTKVEAQVVEKKIGSEKDGSDEKSNLAASTGQIGRRSSSEVMREIQVLLERASGAGNEVSKMLDAGKFRYYEKDSLYQVPSKVLHAITPSVVLVSSQNYEKIGYNEYMEMGSRNISSTLKKLCMWEKKLYDEVKAEEKLRMIHERKCRQLKRLDEKGADVRKVDSLKTLVRNLSTKIKIAIQVVDKISITINKLRDEELWPQINDLIHRLFEMWKAMLECHRCQNQAVTTAKNLDAIVLYGKLNYAHLEVAMQLKSELQNWIFSFTNWINTQKGYIKSLNGWLLRCLLYEPEETPDGVAPFSPSRIGAPSVFVICNHWSQAMERHSEKEVIEAMQGTFMSLNQLLEPYTMDLQQRMPADKDMEIKIKILDREEHKMPKKTQEKKVLEAREGIGAFLLAESVHQNEITGSLPSNFKQIFETLERFTANSTQAYEELCARTEEFTRSL